MTSSERPEAKGASNPTVYHHPYNGTALHGQGAIDTGLRPDRLAEPKSVTFRLFSQRMQRNQAFCRRQMGAGIEKANPIEETKPNV
jgi:hypothetical protein